MKLVVHLQLATKTATMLNRAANGFHVAIFCRFDRIESNSVAS